MNTTTERKTQAALAAVPCSAFFEIRQNNSGGSFDAPAVHVIIAAPSKDEACKRTSPHFSLCGDSGRYAEYDDCGCCPCCGHRWSEPWDDKPEEPAKLVEEIRKNGLKYMGATATALIKADGSIIIGETTECLDAICGYITQNTQAEGTRQ
ncbi:MAG: DUF7296 family protein [Casimicrobium sp.]